MFTQSLQIIGLLFFAAVKLFYSAPVVLAAGYSSLTAFGILSLGGSMGVLVFYYFGGHITLWISQKFSNIFPRKAPKKNFSKKNRLLVLLKQKTGIWGIAFITPVLISIPVGSIIAYTYFRKNNQTLPALIGSVLLWSVLSVLFWGLWL